MISRIANWNFYFLQLFEYYSFVTIFLDFKFRKNKKIRCIGWLIFLTCGVMFLLFNKGKDILLFVAFILCILLFDNNIQRGVLSGLFSFLYISIFETIIEHIIEVYINVKYPYKEIMYLLCIIGIMWIYYLLIPKHLKRGGLSVSNRVYMCLIPVLVMVNLFLAYFSVALEYIDKRELNNIGSVLLVAGGMTIGGGVALLLYTIKDKLTYIEESSLLKKYKDQQKKYYELVLSKEKATRRFRHDIKSQMINIKYFINDGKLKELKNYVDDIYHDIEVIDNNYFDVGNEVINVLLNYYFLPFRNECDIKVKGFIKDGTGLSDRDLSILISNMLTNAIEAVKEIDRSKRFIEFEISDGILLAVIVRNSFKTINKKNGLFCSTKQDKSLHGFGIQNMKNIAEKNNGELIISTDKDVFITEIRLAR